MTIPKELIEAGLEAVRAHPKNDLPLGRREAIWAAVSFLRPRRRGESTGAGLVIAGPVERYESESVTAFQEGRFYLVRLEDGGFEPVSGGTIIYPDGSTRPLSMEEVQVSSLDTWTSPKSDAVYPAGWEFKVPSEGIDLRITPLISDQELQVSFTYWEGAVKIEGTQQGYGYVELTGYKRSIRGRL